MRKHAFTLLELLVSISIVAILASLSISMFSKYKQKAYDAVAQSHAKNVYNALYAADVDKLLQLRPGYNEYSSRGYIVSFIPNSPPSRYDSPASMSGDYSLDEVLPGYTRDPLVRVEASATVMSGGDIRMSVGAMHCNGSDGTTNYGLDEDGNPSADYPTKRFYSLENGRLSTIMGESMFTYCPE